MIAGKVINNVMAHILTMTCTKKILKEGVHNEES